MMTSALTASASTCRSEHVAGRDVTGSGRCANQLLLALTFTPFSVSLLLLTTHYNLIFGNLQAAITAEQEDLGRKQLPEHGATDKYMPNTERASEERAPAGRRAGRNRPNLASLQ